MGRLVAGGTRETAFPSWAGPAERLRYLLRYAILAPSRHNSQPWIFEIEGPELRLFGDWRRSLPVADPQGRELVMACGAALYNLELAASHHGHATSVEVMAGSRKDGLLARFTLEELRAPTPQVERLFAAIPVRRTNRLAFDTRDVPAGVASVLVREAADQGASLRVIDRTLRAAVAELVAEGDRRQWASARYRRELARWLRSNRSGELDGIPGYAHGLSEPASLLHRMLVRLRIQLPAEERRDRHYALKTRALFALCTHADAPAHWLAAGRAMQRVLLRGAADGLSASYFSQVIEVEPVRAQLKQTLGEPGFPQLLFRVGFGCELRSTSRRPIERVLRSFSVASARRAIMRTI